MRRARYVALFLLVAAEIVAIWRVAISDRWQRDWPPSADRALDSFALADRALQRDILTARAGLLRNYDPINADIVAMRDASAAVAQMAAANPALLPMNRRLVADVARREATSERFKSTNALLQNSLDRLANGSASESGDRALGALSTRALRLTLDTSGDAVAEARRQLGEAETMLRSSRTPEEQQLINHARLLTTLLPRVDTLITDFQMLPVERDLSDMRTALALLRQDAATRRERDRAILLVLSLLLLGTLIQFGVRLYIRFVSLRHREEYETLHAAILGLLIDVRPGELEERLNDALKRLANYVLADRAYLIVGDDPTAAHLWSRIGRFAPSRARATIQAVTDAREWIDDHILVEGAAAMPALAGDPAGPGPAPRALLLLRSPASEGMAVLGFEADHAPFRLRPETTTGLSTVMAAFLQTIRRDDLETERIVFERQLARGRRMETIGTLASGIAHNFNNIIGAIAGFAEIAEMHVAPHSQAAPNLGEIRNSARRAQALVDQILGFGRRSERQGERIPVGKLIDEAVSLLRVSLPRGVRLVLMSDSYPFTIQGDGAQLQQVLLNLATNAALAMPTGGTIHCHAERLTLDDSRRLSHATLGRGDYVVITVRDGGVGIAPAALPKLFEPFYTTRERGTGLGLSTAWEIVQDHGGSIDVASRLGDGSRFAIWLPAADASRSGPPEPPRRGSGQSILLLHPDGNRVEQDEELLAMLGYEPWGVVATNPTLPPTIPHDAVIVVQLDLSDPAEWPPAPAGVPVLVARPRPVTPIASKSGAGQTIHYPFRPQEVASALARVLTDKS